MKYLLPTSAILFTGCIQLVGNPTPPECETNSDCNTGAGEVCDEGLCWGDPPGGQYAIEISPPQARGDLIATDLPVLTISADGTMDPVAAQWPDLLSGRIGAQCNGCRDGGAIDATITVRRPSPIPGAPPFISSTTSDPQSVAGDSFALLVPASDPNSPPFHVTIEPSDASPVFPGGPTPAEVVPPLRLDIYPQDLAAGLDVVLTADSIRTVSGQILGAGSQGVAGMRVFAKGRVDPSEPLGRVSTIATTDQNGNFTLLLGSDALDVIDVVAQPPPGTIAPTLIAQDRFVSDSVTLHMPAYAGSTHVTLPVTYVDTNGADAPVASATVQFFTTTQDPTDALVNAVFEVDGQTDDMGHFDADVLAGSDTAPRSYYARITPTADAITASTLQVVEIGGHGGVLSPIRLDQRSIITGTLADAYGTPVDGVNVKAQASLYFLWSLDSDSQQLVAGRAQPQTSSNPDGSFTLWLDPAVSGVPAAYDLDIEPGDFAAVPRTVIPAVDASMTQDLGTQFLPEAARVRGFVTDPNGDSLIGAQVKVFEIEPGLGACVAENAPIDCQPPAVVVATGRVDDDGIVRLTLAR